MRFLLPLLRGALILALPLLIGSCTKSDDDLGRLPDTAYELTLTNNNHLDLTVDVTAPSDAAGQNYVVGIVPSYIYIDEMDQDHEALAKYLTDRLKEQSVDFTKADNKYIFSGNASVNLNKIWGNILSGEEYVAAVFAVDGNGNQISRVKPIAFSTPVGDDATIVATSIDKTNMVIDVTVADGFENYMLVVIPTIALVDLYQNSLNLVMDDARDQYFDADGDGQMVVVVDNKIVFNGSQTIDLTEAGWSWTLRPDTHTTIVIQQISESGELLSRAYYLQESTLPEVPPADGTIEVELGQENPNSIQIGVEVTGEIENYYVTAINTITFTESFYNDFDLLSQTLIDYEKSVNRDFSVVDNVNIFNGSQIIEIAQLEEGTDYAIAVFGITDQGAINTDVSYVVGRTTYGDEPPVDGSLRLTLVEPGINDIEVNVTEIGSVNNYYVGLWPMSDYETTFNSDINALVDYQKEIYNLDFVLVDGSRVFEQSSNIQLRNGWSGITPSTDYLVFAFGISRQGLVNTEIVTLETRTLDAPQSLNNITISVSDITKNNALISTTTTNGDPYYLTVLRASDVEGKSDEEITATIMAPHGTSFEENVANSFLYGGVTGIEVAGLLPGNDYYAVAFVYAYSSVISEVFKSVKFRTEELSGEGTTVPTAAEINLSTTAFGDITVSESSPYMVSMSIEPTDATVKYCYQFIETASLAGTDQEIIANYLALQNDNAAANDLHLADYIEAVVYTGDKALNNYGVSAGTSYTILAFGINTETFQPTTEVKKVEFATVAQ